jgi:hypothetical protein
LFRNSISFETSHAISRPHGLRNTLFLPEVVLKLKFQKRGILPHGKTANLYGNRVLTAQAGEPARDIFENDEQTYAMKAACEEDTPALFCGETRTSAQGNATSC